MISPAALTGAGLFGCHHNHRNKMKVEIEIQLEEGTAKVAGTTTGGGLFVAHKEHRNSQDGSTIMKTHRWSLTHRATGFLISTENTKTAIVEIAKAIVTEFKDVFEAVDIDEIRKRQTALPKKEQAHLEDLRNGISIGSRVRYEHCPLMFGDEVDLYALRSILKGAKKPHALIPTPERRTLSPLHLKRVVSSMIKMGDTTAAITFDSDPIENRGFVKIEGSTGTVCRILARRVD